MKKLIVITMITMAPICFAEGEGKKGKGFGHGKARMIEKFDTDGDGQLSDAEKEVAKAAFQEKKEQMKALRESYDTNGDGTLDEAEKAAFIEAVKENGGCEGKHCDKDKEPAI